MSAHLEQRDRIKDAPAGGAALDRFAADLEALRIAQGGVSYTELAQRITRIREAAGASPAAARVARSTVYDAFRPGRSRISIDLVADIVLALTGDPSSVASWRARAVQDMASGRGLSPVVRKPGGTASIAVRPARRPAFVVLLLVACFALDNLGAQLVADLGVPLYLDMVGTAVAAMLLGPWHGVAVGVANNVLGALLGGNIPGLWFVLVNVVGALIWGYGVRGWFGRSPLRFLSLQILTAVSCSIVAVPILVFVFGGSTGHTGQDALNPLLAELGAGLWAAVFSSNILISIIDKLISGYVGLLAVQLLARHGELRPAFGEGWLPAPHPRSGWSERIRA